MTEYGDSFSPLTYGGLDAMELLSQGTLQRSGLGGHLKGAQSQPTGSGSPGALLILDLLLLPGRRYVNSRI